jgi:signal transduction histidine kinase
VTNLVENALKFDSGVQPIEVTCEGGRVEVADRGPGIAAADRPHVFDRFYRISGNQQSGSGLGLAIVKTITDRLAARIQLSRASMGGLQVDIEFA